MECFKDNAFGQFFSVMHQFHKLNLAELFPDNLTKMEGITLMAIMHLNKEMEEGKTTISELANNTHAKSSAVSRTLKNLEDKGLIERKVNQLDRRNTYVNVTENGKTVIWECNRIMDDFGKTVIEKMKEEDMKRLISYLDELYQVADQELQNRKYNRERKQEDE